MNHPDDLLDEQALGVLDAAHVASLNEHLAVCERCRVRLRSDHEMLASVALGAWSMRAPSTLRARLLSATRESGRLYAMAPALADLFDLSLDKARVTLDALEAPDGWEDGLLPGMGIIYVPGGPRVRSTSTQTYLVKLPPGLDWPNHRHGGEERHLVLEGAITDSRTSRVVRAGETLVSPKGSAHSFHVHEGPPCIGAIVLDGEVEFS